MGGRVKAENIKLCTEDREQMEILMREGRVLIIDYLFTVTLKYQI